MHNEPKTIKAKFSGKCAWCQGRISKGDTIQYHGKGKGVTCDKCTGNGRQTAEDGDAEAEAAFGLEEGTLASDRRLYRQGLTVVRFQSGESFTQNRRGRCEDAPCCGCCS